MTQDRSSTPEESFPFPCLAGVPCRWPDCECQVKAGANAGFFAIGCSDETEILWLSGFDGGINGVWTKDPQKALVFIHKRDADQLISMPGLAAYRPFCQWIPQNIAPQSPKTSDGMQHKHVPVSALWLRRHGDNAEMLFEREGRWYLAASENIDGSFSHICEALGMEKRKPVVEK